jgi:TolB-like protein/Flp pilus assembly protein TadD
MSRSVPNTMSKSAPFLFGSSSGAMSSALCSLDTDRSSRAVSIAIAPQKSPDSLELDLDTELTRSDFSNEVKDALRSYVRTDLLSASPLLRTQLLRRSAPSGTAPQALKTLLTETAESLFSNGRDSKVYRVLELTYFNPAPKQEAAAERLGLSFSTYRRHLTAGVDRLTEWLWRREQELRQAEESAEQTLDLPATDYSDTAARPRLSIVILPFLNLSGEASADHIVDGIVDALIADLSSCLPGSFVISRSTAFTYKDRSVAIREVGNELRVRYVLEGSVLVGADQIRVNAQLIDAETDEHLWADRFDKQRGDTLQFQDEIVGRLSRSVGIQLVRTEGGRGSSSGVVELVMRARGLITDVKRKETAAEAIDLFRQALLRDPECVDAMVGIGLARIYQVIDLHRLEGRDELLAEAEQMISQAAAVAPDHLDMLRARALLLRARGHFSEAVVATEALIARNPADPTAYKELGLNKLYLGETREAVARLRRADAIAPRDPARWTWLQGLGRALMQLGDDAGAVDALSQAIDSNPAFFRGKAMLAAAEALSHNMDAARRHLAEYALIEPNMTIARFDEQRSSVPPDAVSDIYRRESERILEGLRRAGMPDETDLEHEMSMF